MLGRARQNNYKNEEENKEDDEEKKKKIWNTLYENRIVRLLLPVTSYQLPQWFILFFEMEIN